MESENYKIVKTALSNDGKFLYFIHSKTETIDELTADSYSISLAVPSGVTTIFDVTTSEKEAIHILKMATEDFKIEQMGEFEKAMKFIF